MPIEDTMDEIVEAKRVKSEGRYHKFSLKATCAGRK
jgi:hypothetical protein